MRNWKNWAKAAAVRAVKTIAQTAVATIGTSAVLGEVNWIAVASASALAAGVTSLAYFLALLTAVSAPCLAVSTAVNACWTSGVGGSAS